MRADMGGGAVKILHLMRLHHGSEYHHHFGIGVPEEHRLLAARMVNQVERAQMTVKRLFALWYGYAYSRWELRDSKTMVPVNFPSSFILAKGQSP